MALARGCSANINASSLGRTSSSIGSSTSIRISLASKPRRQLLVRSQQGENEPQNNQDDVDSLAKKFLQQQQPRSRSPSSNAPPTPQSTQPSPETQASSEPPSQQTSSTSQQQQQGSREGRRPRSMRGRKGSREPEQKQQQLANVNPYELGRSARRAFDEVWSQVSNLAAPTKSSTYLDDDLMEPSRAVEFEAPQAAYTTVLVVGATGRVGRILVRKLLLRGYKVKALVRKRKGKERDELQAIPSAVEIVEGDIGDMDCCQEAVRNVNKVIFCAAARTPITADLLRVDDRGVVNIAKAMQDEFVRQDFRKRLQDAANRNPELSKNHRALRRLFSKVSKREIADFSQAYHQLRWDVTFCGTPEDIIHRKEGLMPEKFVAKSMAEVFINEEENLVFQGSLIQRNAFAEIGAPIDPRLPNGDLRTANTEGLTLRVRGDGNVYTCVLTTGDGRYYARFPTRVNAYSSVRLPFNAFRAAQPGLPALNPDTAKHIAIRYEARRPPAVAAARAAKGLPADATSGSSLARFDLEIDWIKALPSGEEPDFVLVSCAGRAARAGMSDLDIVRMVRAKRSGEDHLRLSGLGYTVVRPGLLVDEPGGYKALVFDQSDRITEPISAADVADICLRALHEGSARNKTFDVCYEAGTQNEDDSMFELVVSAPDNTKTASYLKRAAGELVKNT